MHRWIPKSALLPALAGVLSLLLASAGLAACSPTPTPEPTATSEPTDVPTALPPPSTATTAATATEAATATAEPTAVPAMATAAGVAPDRPAAAAPPPTAPPPAPAYEVQLWADQPRLPKDLGCTTIHWNVIGAKEVYLRWPNQDENKVEHAGTQEGVCLDEGERAIFTWRIVRQDGSNDIREMALERDD